MELILLCLTSNWSFDKNPAASLVVILAMAKRLGGSLHWLAQMRGDADIKVHIVKSVFFIVILLFIYFY